MIALQSKLTHILPDSETGAAGDRFRLKSLTKSFRSNGIQISAGQRPKDDLLAEGLTEAPPTYLNNGGVRLKVG
jgi:hypothetical protein